MVKIKVTLKKIITDINPEIKMFTVNKRSRKYIYQVVPINFI